MSCNCRINHFLVENTSRAWWRVSLIH